MGNSVISHSAEDDELNGIAEELAGLNEEINLLFENKERGEITTIELAKEALPRLACYFDYKRGGGEFKVLETLIDVLSSELRAQVYYRAKNGRSCIPPDIRNPHKKEITALISNEFPGRYIHDPFLTAVLSTMNRKYLALQLSRIEMCRDLGASNDLIATLLMDAMVVQASRTIVNRLKQIRDCAFEDGRGVVVGYEGPFWFNRIIRPSGKNHRIASIAFCHGYMDGVAPLVNKHMKNIFPGDNEVLKVLELFRAIIYWKSMGLPNTMRRARERPIYKALINGEFELSKQLIIKLVEEFPYSHNLKTIRTVGVSEERLNKLIEDGQGMTIESARNRFLAQHINNSVIVIFNSQGEVTSYLILTARTRDRVYLDQTINEYVTFGSMFNDTGGHVYAGNIAEERTIDKLDNGSYVPVICSDFGMDPNEFQRVISKTKKTKKLPSYILEEVRKKAKTRYGCRKAQAT